MRPARVIVGLVAATALAAAPAHAVDTVELPAGTPVGGVDVGADGLGKTTVLLRHNSGTAFSPFTRAVGALTFATDPTSVPAGPEQRFAFGADGTVVTTFLTGSASSERVQVAVRAPGATTFSAPAPVSTVASRQGVGVPVVEPSGRITVFFQMVVGSDNIVHQITREPGAAAFSAAVPVSPQADALVFEIDATTDPMGGVTVVWSRFTGPRYVIEGSRRAPGAATFIAPVKLSPADKDAQHPSLAVDASGNATVVYDTSEAFGTDVVQAATWPAGSSSPSARQTLSDPADGVDSFDVAAEPGGDVTVAWSRAVDSDPGGMVSVFVPDNVRASTRPAASSTFPTPVDVSPAGVATDSVTLVASAVGTTIGYRGYQAGNALAVVASRGPGQVGFGSPQVLTATGANAFDVSLAADAVGDVTVAFYRSQTGFAAVLDTGGPALEALTIPTSVVVGETFPVSVAPVDSRSALGPTTWRFGDGTTKTGNSLTHVYAAPGSYLVTVSATDAGGVATTAKRRITVTETAAGPTSPPGGAAPPDTTAPKLTKPKLSRTKLRPAARGGALLTKAAKDKRGSTLTVTTDEAGRLRLVLQRQVRGRRSGKTCSLKAKRGKRCTTFKTESTVSSTIATAGVVTRHLSGRRSAKARLPRGSYRLTLVLTDGAGNASKPVTLRFTIVR